jgi:SM-20-related protein
LNPALDPSRLCDAFRARGRVHIPNVLTKESAERIYRCLTHETAWALSFNKGADLCDLDDVSQEERSELMVAASQRARNGFQYFFDNHPLSRDGEAYRDPSHYYARVVAFLNSGTVLSLMRSVTGLPAIEWANAQATLYRPGDFLMLHNDEIGGHKRLAAYVLHFTPHWRPAWGGVLQFFGEDRHIEEGYVPAFNALNILRVPMVHSVSQVALYGGLRYSITGWFHAR